MQGFKFVKDAGEFYIFYNEYQNIGANVFKIGNEDKTEGFSPYGHFSYQHKFFSNMDKNTRDGFLDSVVENT
jgi:hypothetical protein